ncbi:Outer membrane protein TolC [bacterium A37T11]|nr:Outer membrane protein TolC [bacterium A37T11]
MVGTKSFICCFICLTCLFLPHSRAQEKWDLKKCIAYGLENHGSVQIFANQREAAKAVVKENLAAYMPNIRVDGNIEDNLKVQESVIPAGLFGDHDIRVAFTKRFNTNASVQLDQTIYDQSLITGLKANKYSDKQAVLQMEQNQENLIYQISTTYYQLFVSKEQLALLNENLASIKQQQDITALRVEKGVTTEVDLNKIQVNYHNILSQIRIAQNNLEYIENGLKNAMGYPLDRPLPIDSLKVPDAQPALVYPDSANGFQVENRTDYQISQVNSSLAAIDEQRIQMGIIPKVSLFGRYGAIGFGDQLGPAINTMSSFSSIGVKVTVPLLDGFKRQAQYKEAKYKYLNAVASLKLDEQKYQMEYQNSQNNYFQAQKNIDSDRKNMELAKSVFNITDLQYQKGVAGLTDWLSAQQSLREAQNNYLQALYNSCLARIDLAKANGTLKTFYDSL